MNTKKRNRLLGWLANGLFFGALVLVFGFVRKDRQRLMCTSFDVVVDKTNGEFIDRNYVYNELARLGIDPFEGQYLDGINLHAVETAMERNPYVLGAEMYQNVGGALTLFVNQRRPLFRVINAGGASYYVDDHSIKMPLSHEYPARVIVATGRIEENFSDLDRTLRTPNLRALDTLSTFLANHNRLSALFTQMDVDSVGCITLSPRIGNHLVRLGQANNLEHKFENLLAFYRARLHTGGLDQYAIVDIRFQNQVVGIPHGSANTNPVALDAIPTAKPHPADSTTTPTPHPVNAAKH